MKPSDRLKQLHAIGRLDVQTVQAHIAELLAAHPELEEDEILRADMIQGETDAFEILADLVRLVADSKVMELGTDLYLAELRSRRDRFERRGEALRELILKVMNTAQLKKAELPEATLSIRQGSQKVVIVDEAEIPPDYLRVKTEPDKTKIKAVLAMRMHVPGCALSNAEPVLAIHVK